MDKSIRAIEELKVLANHPDSAVSKRAVYVIGLLSDRSVDAAERLIPAHGNYRELSSYIMTEIIYDATVVFCNRFIPIKSRTHDQMVQSARSGKQNIAEGSMDSGTSKKTELKLVGIARGSLEELLLDYQDYLRQHDLPLWDKDHPQAREVRAIAKIKDKSYKTYKTYFEDSSAEIAANAAVCLIHQANYLLDQQLRALDRAFLQNGGFTERLYNLRQQRRQR